MNLKILKQAKDIEKEILEKKDLLENVKKLLPKEDIVEVKVRGTKFNLPKGLFIQEHKKIMKSMEEEIDDLNVQLSKL